MPSIRLADLAQYLNAELCGNGNTIITTISSIESAKAGSITFIMNPKYRKYLINCQASAIILTKNDLPFTKNNALIVRNPHLAYAHTSKIFNSIPKPEKLIASSAAIDPTTKLGKNVSIGQNSTIESGVTLNDNVIIGSGCFIGKNTKIDTGSHLYANVTIYHETNIGKNCVIHSGSVIGSDGFGYANDYGNWVKIFHIGRVIIGNHVEIGACTTVDRGAINDTIISDGVIIDNQCQIAHNVIIGENTAIAGGVVMAGSLKIGRYCMIGGGSVINGHIEICDKVTITGMSMITCSITNPGCYSSGIPFQSNRAWRKTAVLIMNINDIYKRIKILERKINLKN